MKKYFMALIILTVINVVVLKAFGTTNETGFSYTQMYRGYGGLGNPVVRTTKWYNDDGEWRSCRQKTYQMFGDHEWKLRNPEE